MERRRRREREAAAKQAFHCARVGARSRSRPNALLLAGRRSPDRQAPEAGAHRRRSGPRRRPAQARTFPCRPCPVAVAPVVLRPVPLHHVLNPLSPVPCALCPFPCHMRITGHSWLRPCTGQADGARAPGAPARPGVLPRVRPVCRAQLHRLWDGEAKGDGRTRFTQTIGAGGARLTLSDPVTTFALLRLRAYVFSNRPRVPRSLLRSASRRSPAKAW